MRVSKLATILLAVTLLAASDEHIHPPFALLDHQGNPVDDPMGDFDVERSCGQCHDSEFILQNNTHRRHGVEISCLQCHMPGGADSIAPSDLDEEGLLTRPMTAPGCDVCGDCHGVVHRDEQFLEFYPDLMHGQMQSPYGRTLATGEVFSPQQLTFSHIDLRDKDHLDHPWDVHAARGLHCATCHFPSNSPFATGARDPELQHLKWDPRRMDLSAYLQQPDHEFAVADCTDCHDPDRAHDTLPYARRHVQALACQSCHVPTLHAPALRSVDRTVVTGDGGPRMDFRGVDVTRGSRYPNTWYYRGYQPVLLNEKRDGKNVLTPFNIVTTWRWVHGKTGEPVDDETVRKVFLTHEGAWRPEILDALDADGDGLIADEELILDTPRKTDLVASMLASLGVDSPRIQGLIETHPIRHGVVSGSWVEHDCNSCHTDRSRLDVAVQLASGPFPGDVQPAPDQETVARLGGRDIQNVDGALMLGGDVEPEGHYVLGYSRRPWSDWLGFLLFALTVLGVAVHAGLRAVNRRKRKDAALRAPAAPGKVYMYGLYERIWHWTMAISVIALLITGMGIHFPGWLALGQYRSLVFIHNFASAVLLINAGLGMFFHLATGEIRQFIPARAGLVRRIWIQATYYIKGIFVGASHPFAKTRKNKLNPLQQFTYAGLLNVLFPFQVVTGLLLWLNGILPEQTVNYGGLSIVAPLHNLGSWLFLSFLVLHVYLTTTGTTVTSNIEAMLTGWEKTEHEPSDEPVEEVHG